MTICSSQALCIFTYSHNILILFYYLHTDIFAYSCNLYSTYCSWELENTCLFLHEFYQYSNNFRCLCIERNSVYWRNYYSKLLCMV